MDFVLILVVAFLVLPLIGLGRLAWGVWFRNEQLQPGGSDGRQIFGRK
jgi:hypothetical protein